MSKSSKRLETLSPVADICLYGRGHGAGWIAAAGARSFGDGETHVTRSFTEAIFQAVDALAAAGVRAGVARVFDSGGDRMSTIDLAACIPYYGDLVWTAAPVYTISAEALIAAAREVR